MKTPTKNPFTWVEIYVDDMSRAQKFYEAVFKIQLVEMPMEGMGNLQMLSFPWSEEDKNISGA